MKVMAAANRFTVIAFDGQNPPVQQRRRRAMLLGRRSGHAHPTSVG
jgi:hypothetical protein